MPAVLTGIDVAAKRGRAAILDRRHDLELGQAQVTGLSGTIAGAFSSEDIGDLDRGAQAALAAGILVLAPAPPNAPEDWSPSGSFLSRDTRIERGRIELAVPQQS